MSRKFRVVTEGHEEHGHRFEKGDIVARIHGVTVFLRDIGEIVCLPTPSEKKA